jgi:hypothetical protein
MEGIDARFGRFRDLAEERYILMRNNGDLGQRFTGALFVLSYVMSGFSKASSWKPEWFPFVFNCASQNVSSDSVQAMDACAESARATQDMLRKIMCFTACPLQVQNVQSVQGVLSLTWHVLLQFFAICA